MSEYQKFQQTSNKAIRTGVLLLFSILIIGTAGYMSLEGLSFLDGLYMSVITISTVGFKEVGNHEFDAVGKVFTIFLILISLGTLAYIGSTLIRFIVDGELKHYLKLHKVDKKIQQLKNHVIVVGYGRNGEQAVTELRENNVDCVVIEKRENVIARIEEDNSLLYIKGDATQEDILEKARVRDAKAIIITLPEDADNVFVVLSVRSLSKNMVIISRASEMRSVKKLRLAGANNVIMPELIGGQQMAKLVHQPDIVEFLDSVLLQKSKDVQLVEISCENLSKSFDGKSIGDLKIREHSGANIVGIKSANMKYIFNPDPTTILTNEIKLFVLGNPEQIANLKNWLEFGK
ncbi:K+ transport system, NAD-binding component [uncultured Paludibacter sp.]|uniref:K+ transport system, NAD-binding component n=1 Tax=uncultured Paludibacter sp. TaxID=497635 RepID=A0A653A515_9BACT|nr:K+ transport system, NAD-binding component [uncultured Paludibacter sp.]